MKKHFNNCVKNINKTKVVKRKQPHVKILDPSSDDDDNGPELFQAQPSDEIPRNKLVEKLARGLQSYV